MYVPTKKQKKNKNNINNNKNVPKSEAISSLSEI